MSKLEINKNDLLNNLNIIKMNKNEKTELIAVVKANGMGLGLIDFTNFLIQNNVNYFAVSRIEDAVTLRNIDKTIKILMLIPTSLISEIEALIYNNIILSIDAVEQLNIIEKIKKNCVCHIKIDTGFGRHGFLYYDFSDIIKCFNYKNIVVEAMFTHFSSPLNEKYTTLQYNRFNQIINYIKENNIPLPKLHVSSSVPFIKYKDMNLDMIRIGSLLLGRTSVTLEGIKTIGILKCPIFKIKYFPANYNIGYSNVYKTKRPTIAAFLNIGTLDGFAMKKERDYFNFKNNIFSSVKEFLKNRKNIYVTINDKKYHYIGRLDINILIIDITNNPSIKVGDEVEVNISPINVSEKINRHYF